MPPKYLILIFLTSSSAKPEENCSPVIIHLILNMSILSPNSHILHANIQHHSHVAGYGSASIFPESRRFGFDRSQKKILKSGTATCASFWPELFKPEAIEMEPIRDCEQFDHILDQAKELSQPVLVDWMAAWCRKCIYLKPKLEKLAAEYDTKLMFYCVDVNNVPQALVKRGNIAKMPTIQIWKDGELKAEVIGGHKAWLVIEEVREMINQYV